MGKYDLQNSIEENMAIIKEEQFIKVEAVGEDKTIFCVVDEVVKEDGIEIARTRKRSSYEPNADISEAHEEVKKLADLYWTDEHKTSFQNKMDLI